MIQEKLLRFYKYKEKLEQSCPSRIIYYFTLSKLLLYHFFLIKINNTVGV